MGTKLAHSLFILFALSGALFLSYDPALALNREDVNWSSDQVELRGTLYLPDAEGPHPAFVFLHGSGPETRSGIIYTQYARQFAKNGIAMLLYDKRGAGKSTGNWRTASYEELALDAVRGIAVLAERADIDASRLGVIGASEGGWTGPLAANLSGQVSLLVLISAAPMSPFKQGLFDLETSMRAGGATDEDVQRAFELAELEHRVLATKEGWDELESVIEEAKTQNWYVLAESPTMPDLNAPQSNWARRLLDYDPLLALLALKVPVLMLYGENDVLVDAARSARVMVELKGEQMKDFTIYAYAEGRHNLTSNGVTLADDHWERVFSWIRKYW